MSCAPLPRQELLPGKIHKEIKEEEYFTSVIGDRLLCCVAFLVDNSSELEDPKVCRFLNFLW